MFIGRSDELIYLNNSYRSKNSEMIVMYGRRRIGKTELLRKFAVDKKHLFFSCDLSTEKEQLRQISTAIYDLTKEPFLKDSIFTSWESVFEHLFTKFSESIDLIIFDEFPYLCNSNHALPSILQKLWDKYHKSKTINLILCGSYISFMEKEVLGAKSPLFGRRTGQIFLQPFTFEEAREMLPKYDKREMVYTYSILGGIPAYLEKFDDNISIEANVKEKILDKNSYLFSEPRFLLIEELREPSTYFDIIRSLAFGNTRLNDISQDTQIHDRAKVNKYLSVLKKLHIIDRQVPVTEDKPEKSRKGIYRLEDQLFRFWFRFIFPNISYLQEREVDYVWETKIESLLDDFTGASFEKICIERVKSLNKYNYLPFKFMKIGRWWDKSEEIDIVCVDEVGNYLFGECKWRNRKLGKKEYFQLEEKSKQFSVKGEKYFCFLSRSGFSPTLWNLAAKDKNILLFDYCEE
ncbi:ATP-binding protein [bacterium]|nr:ATP-binding protein [bacterium]